MKVDPPVISWNMDHLFGGDFSEKTSIQFGDFPSSDMMLYRFRETWGICMISADVSCQTGEYGYFYRFKW